MIDKSDYAELAKNTKNAYRKRFWLSLPLLPVLIFTRFYNTTRNIGRGYKLLTGKNIVLAARILTYGCTILRQLIDFVLFVYLNVRKHHAVSEKRKTLVLPLIITDVTAKYNGIISASENIKTGGAVAARQNMDTAKHYNTHTVNVSRQGVRADETTDVPCHQEAGEVILKKTTIGEQYYFFSEASPHQGIAMRTYDPVSNTGETVDGRRIHIIKNINTDVSEIPL